jgi:hypothetical protein
VSKSLRKLAEGRECYFRLAPFCRRDTQYTVLCHFRVGSTGGMGLKPPDVCGAPGCDMCHAVIDGRLKQSVYNDVQLEAESHRAHNQWLSFLWKNEILIVVAA